MNLTFLGTASAQPSTTRNHSALALRVGGDVWLFDCGEATQRQIQKSTVKMGKITKIFITHTHGDHIFGLAPLMASCMNGAGGTADGAEDERLKTSPEDLKTLEIYGPLGTRAYVRSNLAYTRTLLEGRYVVHELRFPSDPPDGDYTSLPLHRCELPTGRNIPQTPPTDTPTPSVSYKNNTSPWMDIYKDSLISVSAAPIWHSVPCVGYAVTEAPVPVKMDPGAYIPLIKRAGAPMSVLSRIQRGEDVTLPDGTHLRGLGKRPGRKVVVLGDTYDASPIADIAMDADVLVHEATNAHLPGLDPATKDTDTHESVEKRTRSRGHSTPQVAGRFARRVRARKLILNHFSARYRGDDDVNDEAREVMGAIKSLAEQEFKGEVLCARDFMSLDVEYFTDPAK
ncbi:Metallo-hydrolase/oxidoreductase [Rickenella mellea]|uniref:Metallo-hydrolase/oxidoreductase n=1 Tax=Rickenella mellea TaxID=50990 RepID=A0A4R5XFK9_9AGAM|nr:Metallo-hydrolase/oxidoreductase [Rickenella mellea]